MRPAWLLASIQFMVLDQVSSHFAEHVGLFRPRLYRHFLHIGTSLDDNPIPYERISVYITSMFLTAGYPKRKLEILTTYKSRRHNICIIPEHNSRT